MSKIVVRIQGGLGNQMFQFAYAYILSKKQNSEIVLDIRDYKTYRDWPFSLTDFCLTDYTSTSEEKKLKYDKRIFWFKAHRFLKNFFKIKLSPNFKKSWERKGFLFGNTFSPLPSFPLKNETYLYGYFQNAELLCPYKTELSDVFSVKNRSEKLKQYTKKIKRNSIAISVRVAETIELQKGEKYIYSDDDYYISRINEIKKVRGSVQLVVMSNQIDLLKKRSFFASLSDDVLYIDGLSAAEQIEIFKLCRDYIISNSTFCWWGAFLGSKENDSLIFAPKIWYQGEQIEETRLFFRGMIIDNE